MTSKLRGPLSGVVSRIVGRLAYDYHHDPRSVKHRLPWLSHLMAYSAGGAVSISVIVGGLLGQPTHELANAAVWGLMAVFVGSIVLHVVLWVAGRVIVHTDVSSRLSDGGRI